MPANYRGDIIFISDSQGFYKEGKALEECLNAMIDEFTGYWAPIFYPNPVGFQIGYDSDWSNDKLWWSKLPQTLSKICRRGYF